HPGAPRHDLAGPGRDHGAGRGRALRNLARADLLDDRPDYRRALLLLGGAQVGGAAGAAVAQRAPLESDELRSRGRRRDHLLHPLPDPGLSEGHRLVPVRDQPDALLAVRDRVDRGAHPGHVGLLLLRCARGRAAVYLRDCLHGDRRRALPAALLLSRSHPQALPQAAAGQRRAPRKRLTVPAGPERLLGTLWVLRLAGSSASTFTSARSAQAL